MSLRNLLPTTILVLAVAPAADAWKVTTHMVAATKAVKQVEDADLRAVLESNVAAVRGGAVGPDVFYFPPSFAQSLGAGVRAYKDRTAFSDMAHYCKTDQLAKNMINLAGGDPALKAFGYGWFSHNVTDSVAHPWVNGFTGQPYVDWNCGKDPRGCGLNSLHMFER